MVKIKNAATIILIRKNGFRKFVLMGKRRSNLVFMPNKYVFPGGTWEPQDNLVPFCRGLSRRQKKLLMLNTQFTSSHNLGITAVRELWEETGLRISSKAKVAVFP